MEATPSTSERCIGLAGGSVACGARRCGAVGGAGAVGWVDGSGRAGWYRTGACAEKRHAVHARCHQQGTAEKEHQVEYGVGNGDSKLSLSSPSHAKPHRRACRTASARSTSCVMDGGLQLSQGEVSRSYRGDGTAEGVEPATRAQEKTLLL